MKIFYTCIGSVFKVFYDLNRSLADLNNIESSFYLTDKIYSKNFIEKNNIILKNSIKEWELIEECKKNKIRINKKFKNIINEEFLWKAAVADRRLYNGTYAKHTQNHNTNLDHKFIHKLICYSYAKIYNHLNTFKPDLIVSHSTATFGIFITYMIAKRLNINFVNLRYTKIDNYVTFSKDNEEKYDHIRKNFLKKKLNNKSINLAKKFILKYRYKKNFKYSGSPFFKLSSKLFLLDIFKNFPRAIYSEIKYIFLLKSKSDLHSLNHPLKTYYFDNILRFGRSLIISKYVKKINNLKNIGKYAFFPLHAEPELSLSVFANSYQNQIETIRNLSFRLPPDTKLVVKDHPRNFCKRNLSYLNKINKIPNVILVDPRTSTRELIKNSYVNIVLSGFIGFEAIILKKPVITFSSSIINILPKNMVLKVKNFEDFENKYFDFLKNYKHNEKTLINFVSSIISNAAPIELINVLLKKKGRYGTKYSTQEYSKNQIKLKKLFIDFIKKSFSMNLK